MCRATPPTADVGRRALSSLGSESLACGEEDRDSRNSKRSEDSRLRGLGRIPVLRGVDVVLILLDENDIKTCKFT